VKTGDLILSWVCAGFGGEGRAAGDGAFSGFPFLPEVFIGGGERGSSVPRYGALFSARHVQLAAV